MFPMEAFFSLLLFTIRSGSKQMLASGTIIRAISWHSTKRSHPLHLIAFKGLPATGKSTLARALARELSWPLIDKDDIKDVLDGHTLEAGGLAYDTLFNLVRRQALLGLDVICDSPLTFERSYTRLREIAGETGAKLFIVESTCSDEQAWLERIEARKMLSLPAHHQTRLERASELPPVGFNNICLSHPRSPSHCGYNSTAIRTVERDHSLADSAIIIQTLLINNDNAEIVTKNLFHKFLVTISALSLL